MSTVRKFEKELNKPAVKLAENKLETKVSLSEKKKQCVELLTQLIFNKLNYRENFRNINDMLTEDGQIDILAQQIIKVKASKNTFPVLHLGRLSTQNQKGQVQSSVELSNILKGLFHCEPKTYCLFFKKKDLSVIETDLRSTKGKTWSPFFVVNNERGLDLLIARVQKYLRDELKNNQDDLNEDNSTRDRANALSTRQA